MDEQVLKWLYDVKYAIEEIESYFKDNPKDFSKYKKTLILKRAIERDLEIIGEAIGRIAKRDKSVLGEISNAQAIIGLRNQVIHAYDNISDENIWSIIVKHLPILKKEVDHLLNI